MADVTLSYKGSDILELSDSGSATLKTGGTYCEADIEVEYVKPSGGGSPWELIADHTSDAIATVVTAEIPSAYQTENVYKVEILAEFNKLEYPYYGVNNAFTAYDNSRAQNTPWTFIGYVVKKEANDTASYNLIMSKTMVINGNTIESVSLKSYYADAIKAGCNIKVWRLVE